MKKQLDRPQTSSCSLCQNKGCISLFFRQKEPEGKPIPSIVLTILYGLSLLGLLSGAVIGAYFSELYSMMGAASGLFTVFIVLRSCQQALNRLSLRDQQET